MPVIARISIVALVLCANLAGVTAFAQTGTHAADVQRILTSPAFKAASGILDKEHGRIVEDGIKLTEIPSPLFKRRSFVPKRMSRCSRMWA